MAMQTADDKALTKHILSCHAPDGRSHNVKPLFNVVEEILQPFNLGTGGPADMFAVPFATFDDKTQDIDFVGMLVEELTYIIHQIYSKISLGGYGGDAHETTIEVLKILSCFAWEAKMVLTLVAFGVNYGEFWLVVQLYSPDQLANSIAFLKGASDFPEENKTLEPKIEGLKNLMKGILDISKCILGFSDFPVQYNTLDTPALSNALASIPTAVYWTIRSVVACWWQSIGIISLDQESITTAADKLTSTTEGWELSAFASKVEAMHRHLTLCYQQLDEKRDSDAYQAIVRLVQMTHTDDNTKILKAFIPVHDNQLPLYDSSTKKRVSVDVLSKTIVLLLISDLEISQEEIAILEQLYNEARHFSQPQKNLYEVVWLPVVDRSTPWSVEKQKQFETLQFMMPWHSLHHPSLLEPTALHYMKKNWNFAKKPIVVVLDQQGRVANPNALHMMWIWGSVAFPFTSMREDVLWKEETWRLELLIDGIDPLTLSWLAEGKPICLYGGEDIDWIRKFTLTARKVSRATWTPLELLYVGKSNPSEKVRRNNETIADEKLSHYWSDLTLIWFFWVRIESMWYSKMQQGKTADNDPLMQELVKMLSYDVSGKGWAIISKGPEMATAKGDTMLVSFKEFDHWKEHVEERGFVHALNDHLHQVQTPPLGVHLALATSTAEKAS
ncbi:hypothetical protein IFM89_013383 [Coptis chinensis]|uniref:Uncharacterized protein n=1 Tax=Coptis chinensis TaxID=261450 RepID=A0A835LZT7_9MAGN|nr:hypothetical protein IFM89_013383 [Coptis chinensis]